MKANDSGRKIDGLVRTAIGRDHLTFDFERWKREHRKEIDEFHAQTATERTRRHAGAHLIGRLGKRPMAKLAVAAALVVVFWMGTRRLTDPCSGLAFGEVLAHTAKIQTFHATICENGKESEVWGKRPNMLRCVYDEDIIEISNGPTLWVVNIPFNKATQKSSYYFEGAQRRGLDVIDDFLQVRFTEGLSGFFSEEPVGRVRREGKVFDVYRMEFNTQEGLTNSEALVEAETHLLHSLSIQVGQGDDISGDLKFMVTDYDLPLSDELFTFEPGATMKVTVEEAEPSPAQPMAAEEGSTLSGRITWAHNGKPVSGARLTLWGGGVVTTPDGKNQREFFENVETDRDGHWHIAAVPEGPIRFSVRSWEFEWPAMPMFTTNVGTSKAPRVIVDGQSEYTGLDFKVYKPDDFYAHLTATVINEDGEPVRNVSAHLMYADSGDMHQHVYATKRRHQYTQRDGRFDDSEIWPTCQSVKMHLGHKDPNGPYPRRGTYTEPFIIASAQEYHLDIVLPYERELTVQVLDVRGNPLEGICVCLLDSRWGGSFWPLSYRLEDQVFSDSNGLVHGSGLLPGENILVALKRLDIEEPDVWNPLATTVTPATAPTGRDVPLVQVTFHDRPIVVEGKIDPGFAIKSCSVHVSVTGEPGDVRHMPFILTKTDEEGHFTLRGVPAGSVRLLYSAVGPNRDSRRGEGRMTVEPGNRYRVEFTEQGLQLLDHDLIP